MSYDDDHRGNPNAGRDRGAYTPPTDDDLPFTRGGYDPRRAPAAKSPPITLIISAIVLLLLIVAVVVFYRSGVRSSTDAPPAVGTPVESMKVEAPLDAQPIDPEADIRVYRDGGEPSDAAPTFTPGPEEVLPRPAPTTPAAPVESSVPPPAAPAPATKAPAAPAPVTPAPATKAPAPAPAPARARDGADVVCPVVRRFTAAPAGTPSSTRSPPAAAAGRSCTAGRSGRRSRGPWAPPRRTGWTAGPGTGGAPPGGRGCRS